MIYARLTTLLALAASLPFAKSAPPVEFDVYAPPVLTPNRGTVWHSGSKTYVIWDDKNPPASITNPLGKIYLVKDSVIRFENLLASGFELLDGRVEIVVPEVTPGSYQIVLIGDSGNFSPTFTIEK